MFKDSQEGKTRFADDATIEYIKQLEADKAVLIDQLKYAIKFLRADEHDYIADMIEQKIEGMTK